MPNDSDTPPAPPSPRSSERLRHLVGRLRQARKDHGWSQEELADRIIAHSRKVAERFGEEPIFSSLSKNMISRWERMFEPNAGALHKSARVNMSAMTYAHWARALGYRMFIDFVPADVSGRHVFVLEPSAKLLEQFNALPEHQQHLVRELIQELWAVYREDHDAIMPKLPAHSKK